MPAIIPNTHATNSKNNVNQTISADSPYRVYSTRSLTKMPDREHANQILIQLLNITRPLLQRRQWKVKNLIEFYPRNPGLLGLNVNHGFKIMVRLRDAQKPSLFLDLESILGTFLHELTHNEISAHSYEFYTMLEQVEGEVQSDMIKMGWYSLQQVPTVSVVYDWNSSKGQKLGSSSSGNSSGPNAVGGSKVTLVNGVITTVGGNTSSNGSSSKGRVLGTGNNSGGSSSSTNSNTGVRLGGSNSIGGGLVDLTSNTTVSGKGKGKPSTTTTTTTTSITGKAGEVYVNPYRAQSNQSRGIDPIPIGLQVPEKALTKREILARAAEQRASTSTTTSSTSTVREREREVIAPGIVLTQDLFKHSRSKRRESDAQGCASTPSTTTTNTTAVAGSGSSSSPIGLLYDESRFSVEEMDLTISMTQEVRVYDLTIDDGEREGERDCVDDAMMYESIGRETQRDTETEREGDRESDSDILTSWGEERERGKKIDRERKEEIVVRVSESDDKREGESVTDSDEEELFTFCPPCTTTRGTTVIKRGTDGKNENNDKVNSGSNYKIRFGEVDIVSDDVVIDDDVISLSTEPTLALTQPLPLPQPSRNTGRKRDREDDQVIQVIESTPNGMNAEDDDIPAWVLEDYARLNGNSNKPKDVVDLTLLESPPLLVSSSRSTRVIGKAKPVGSNMRDIECIDLC